LREAVIEGDKTKERIEMFLPPNATIKEKELLI
jgi:hypothetical protein